MRNVRRSLTSLVVATSMVGCSGAEDAINKSVTSLGANIAGVVTESSSNSSLSAPNQSFAHRAFAKFMGQKSEYSTQSVSGCSVQAYDLASGDAVGNSTTTDSNGEYTITGVTSGSTYRVVANCGSFELASVSTADETAPADKEREVTNPLSSLVASMIVKNVIEQISSSFGGMSESLKQQAIKALAPVVMSVVKATVEESVNNGTLVPPTTSEVRSVAATLKDKTKGASDIGSAITNYETDSRKAIPPSVSQSGDAAKAQASALKDCDSRIETSTIATCTKAVTKLLYNSLGFGVAINTSSGGDGVYKGSACNETALGAEFPNANFQSGGEIPAEYCFITPKIRPNDRNNEQEGGNKNDMVFIESGTATMGQNSMPVVGFLSELGKALFGKNKYLLSDLDKVVFSYNSDAKAGMNARLIQRKDNPGANGMVSSYYYEDASGWHALGNEPSAAGQPMRPDQILRALDISTGWNWTLFDDPESAPFSPVVTALAGSRDLTLAKGIFAKKFGGPVPTMQQIDSKMNNSKMHKDFNPSGQKEFYVLFGEQPRWEEVGQDNSRNRPCDDNDITTPCKGVSGSLHPEVLATVGFGDGLSDGDFKKVRPLSQLDIVASSSCAISISDLKTKPACFYLQPVFDQKGFRGVFNFIRSFDGQYLKDELNNSRAVKVASNSDCGTNNIPVNCLNKVYEVRTNWDNGMMNFKIISNREVTLGESVGTKLNGVSNFNEIWKPNNSGKQSPATIGKFDNTGGTSLLLTGSVDFSASTPSLASFSSSFESGSYKAVVYRQCDQNGCNQNPSAANAQIYLVDKNTGGPISGGGEDCQVIQQNMQINEACPWKNNAAVIWNCTESSCSPVQTPLFAASELLTAAAGNVNEISNFFIPSGPVPNPNWLCAQEPFFIDGNGDGVLNCDANNPHSTPLRGDISFSDFGNLEHYKSQPGHQNASYLPNQNAYQYADPVGPKKLLTTAFNGWLDGNHKLTATTELDALQAFSLIYMFFQEGSENIHIDGIDSRKEFSNFVVISPLFADNNRGPFYFNQALGKGLTTFKQGAPGTPK